MGQRPPATFHKHSHYREKHTIYSNLFIERGSIDRLLAAVLAHNRAAAQRCGYAGPVDVPVNPGARGPLL